MKHLTFFLLSVLFSTMTFAQNPDSWDGTIEAFDMSDNKGDEKTNPILITNAKQLAYLAVQVNTGESTYLGKYFKLTTDLDLNNLEWTPIGWHITNANSRHFKGHFDGDGHIIYNMTITEPKKITDTTGALDKDMTTYGLFGSADGNIRNLGIDGESEISVGANVGGIVGNLAGTGVKGGGGVYNCYNKATITGTSYAGGIVGYSTSTPDVRNCYNVGKISMNATATKNKGLGGIMGMTGTAYFYNCYNFGTLSVIGSIPTTMIGGITGGYPNRPDFPPFLCFYVDNCAGVTNNIGVTKSESDMLSQAFLNELNGDAYPELYVADSKVVNNGLPVLRWEVQGTADMKTNAKETAGMLSQNYPNPSLDETVIDYRVNETGFVRITLFNSLGQAIQVLKAGVESEGSHSLLVNTSNLSSGIYTYQMSLNGQVISKSMCVK